MSPYLGAMERYGCPLSRDVDVGSNAEEASKHETKNLRHVLEGSLWELIHPFLVSDDVLGMRAAASR